jgi:NADPH-dependent 2,4-dienoyl-CoA reductase/sulfur reductase-like enzyme/peroxiredoxin family protein/rhodanese-related sulfurtransferase/TusA-related sulfurtransferase
MSDSKRILIVGGVAGGASTAARARRLSEDAEIILFERGEHVSFANCGLPYHIGGAIADRKKLLIQTPASLNKRFNIDVRVRSEVVSIDRAACEIIVRDLTDGREYAEHYDALVLSPGAEPIRPPIDGFDSEGVFTLRNMADMDAIITALETNAPERAVVVGGGYIGLEMTEALRERGLAVTLVEMADQVFIPGDPEMVTPLHQQLQLQGVDLRLSNAVSGIVAEGNNLTVALKDGSTVECGIVILAIGVRPETSLAREAGVELGERGIKVDAHMRTSDANIYAVGDAVEVTHFVGGNQTAIPLAGPANRQGRIAADNIFGRPSSYANTQGTAICKVFDLAIGMTGLSEKELVRLGMDYEKVYVHPASHAGYYPGAAPMNLKLLFDMATGKVLGAQAVGADGVDKRIDVLAMAIRAGLTVEDLAEQELSYAPPFGSAKDPVNYAGFVASNVRLGDMPVCHVADVLNPRDDQVVLDVRTPAEVEAGTIPGSINIPVDDLRERIGELPADKELLVFCKVGQRGYIATRILLNHGLRCRNLSGGITTYKAVTHTVEPKHQGASMTNEPKTGASCCRTSTDASCNCSPASAETTQEIDARALQCPGPIMRIKEAMDALATGQSIGITVGDPGFPADVAAWCESTGNTLGSVTPSDGGVRAVIVKGQGVPVATGGASGTGKTMVVFSGDLDKVLAAFIIANGAAAMGSKVTLFFTFWGLNALRRDGGVKVKKNFIETMFSFMMPRGARKLKLSNMHMMGMGDAMIRGIMKRKNVASLPELMASAQAAGVRLVACTMSMDLMGIKREELIDGVDEGGVATFLNSAEQSNMSLFV